MRPRHVGISSSSGVEQQPQLQEEVAVAVAVEAVEAVVVEEEEEALGVRRHCVSSSSCDSVTRSIRDNRNTMRMRREGTGR
jgi:hypothetical protein